MCPPRLSNLRLTAGVQSGTRRNSIPNLNKAFAVPFLCVLAATSSAAHGIGLGDLVVESRLGAPLQAYVRLTVGPGEVVDQFCLALGRPGTPADTNRYLSRARLSVETDGGGQRIRISTSEPVQERVFTILLEAGCTSRQRITKEYAVLLEPEQPPPPAFGHGGTAATGSSGAMRPSESIVEWTIRPGETLSSIARAVYPRGSSMRAKLIHAIVRLNPAAFPDANPDRVAAGTVITIPDLRTIAAEPVPTPKLTAAMTPTLAAKETPAPEAKPVKKKAQAPAPKTTVQTAKAPSEKPAQFRLKLATEGVNLSLIGKLGEAERKFLRERQHLLDSDDQMASFLALKHQVSQLEAQLADMRATVNRPGSPLPLAPRASPGPTSDMLEIVKYGLTLYLLPAAQILSAFLALFFLLRYYRNIKASLLRSGALFVLKKRPSVRRPVLVEPDKSVVVGTEFDRALVAAATPEKAAVPEAAQAKHEPSIDEILEEAQLYVIHGHPERAIELLEEQIRTSRGEVRVWMLLFVIFRSQGMKVDFGKLAQRFRTIIQDPELWENVRALGHELDPANELYFTEAERQRAAAIQLVFEIPEEEKSESKPA